MASRAIGCVSRWGECGGSGIPSSDRLGPVCGFVARAGTTPADNASRPSGLDLLKIASAITERPAFPTHTNSTVLREVMKECRPGPHPWIWPVSPTPSRERADGRAQLRKRDRRTAALGPRTTAENETAELVSSPRSPLPTPPSQSSAGAPGKRSLACRGPRDRRVRADAQLLPRSSCCARSVGPLPPSKTAVRCRHYGPPVNARQRGGGSGARQLGAPTSRVPAAQTERPKLLGSTDEGLFSPSAASRGP